MSTRDFQRSVVNAFKVAYGDDGDYGFIGHYMPVLADASGHYNSTYGSVYPQHGSLLLINDDVQDWSVPCNIEINYNYSEISGFINYNYLNHVIEKPVYVSGFSGTSIFTIQTGTRAFSQQIYTGHRNIYEITSIVSTDPHQDVSFYLLGDDGAKFLHGMNTELERDALDKTINAIWVHPPPCVYCEGDGIYNGATCPRCAGRKFIGYNAEGWLLEQKARDLGVVRKEDSDTSVQYRAWAKKHWVTPTYSGILNYVSSITKIDTDNITIVENNGRECNLEITIPIMQGGTYVTGSVSYNSPFDKVSFLEEVIQDAMPAGVNAIIYNTYQTTDASVMEYSNGYTSREVIGISQWSDWSNFPNYTTDIEYTGSNTSGIQISGTQGWRFFEPAFSELNTPAADSFYDYLTEEQYNEIFLYDNGWVLDGTSVIYR